MANLVLVLLLVFFLIVVVGMVQGRLIGLKASDELVSDGADDADDESPFLSLYSSSSSSSSSNTCQHMYGFLPCADNIGGYIVQIVVYQYLLALGEKFVTRGSKTIFNILGTGFFGATLFGLFRVLPRIVLVIVSGVFTTKEDAEYQVSVGVASYAGSTVFQLTLLWGVCVIYGTKYFHLKDSGIKIDKETKYTAGIMLLSLIPFIILQLMNIFNTSSRRIVILIIALIASASSLILYFIYQIWDPWIQERSLEYSKYEHLLAGFLQHVQRHAGGKLVDENGQPNIPVIKRLFAETDTDKDTCLTHTEVEALLLEIQSENGQIDNEYAVAEMLKSFDLNKNGEINEDEFVEGVTKWIDKAKELAEKGCSTSRKSLRQVVQPWIDEKRHELTKIELVMSRFLKHVHSQGDSLLTDDRRPNLDRIKSLFAQFDSDNDNHISQAELKKLIESVEFGEIPVVHVDEVVEEMMKEFDGDGDGNINEQEFVSGATKWLNKATRVAKCNDANRVIDEFDKIMWKEVDSLVYGVEKNGHIIKKLLTWDFNKSVLEIVLGLAILTFLGGPLVSNITMLSDALGVPSFFISFVIVPLAMNARMTLSAIFPASQKSERTASLTFSEIYGGVVMNNIMGLSALLAIVYAKDLAWDYSAEVLIVLVVCAILGLLAFFRSTYPLWTCILAFFLYPFSLLMFYVFGYAWGWE